MLPTMVTLWGVVCTMQGNIQMSPSDSIFKRLDFLSGIVHSYHGLLACRFFLGLLEGEFVKKMLA